MLIAAILVSIVGSFSCSIMEAVMLSLSPAQLAALHEKHPRTAAIWQGFKDQIDRPLAAILILNTTANTLGATLAAVQFESLFGVTYLLPFSMVFTLAILMLSEILPKTLGFTFAGKLAIVVAPVLKAITAFLMPVILVTNLFAKAVTGSRDKSKRVVLAEEIGALATLARTSNVIRRHQEKIITGAARLGRLKISDVMIPKEQIVFMYLDSTLVENLLIAHFNPHTRFPVKPNAGSDQLLGYINFKELVFLARTNPNVTTVQGIVRPIPSVRPDETVDRVMERFVSEHAHLALVTTPEGALEGLVTLEDLVEELVGEIEDEFDHLPSMIHRLPGETWMLGGKLPPGDVFALTGISTEVPAQKNLSEWIISRLGHIPKASESFRVDHHEVTARRVRKGQVFEATIRKLSDRELAGPVSAPASPQT